MPSRWTRGLLHIDSPLNSQERSNSFRDGRRVYEASTTQATDSLLPQDIERRQNDHIQPPPEGSEERTEL
jgi:hypothetical protein